MPNHRYATLLSAVAIATTAGLAVPSPARAVDYPTVYTIESRLYIAAGPPGRHLCLQPVDESTVEGAAIVQQPCADTKAGTPLAQQWILEPLSGNMFHFVNMKSRLCLDA